VCFEQLKCIIETPPWEANIRREIFCTTDDPGFGECR
jgi:hypothetical protein